MKKILIAYVPVLHQGYRLFFERHKDVSTLYIVGRELLLDFPHLSKELKGKDIRALIPENAKSAIEAWKIFTRVEILDKKTAEKLQDALTVMAKDDVSEEIATHYFPNAEIEWDSVFLRWDKKNTLAENVIQPDRKISKGEFDKEMMQSAQNEAEKSVDWWRRIGAVAVKDGKVILKTHNVYVPSSEAPYYEGDPRGNFGAGEKLELSLVLHSEAGIVAEAAKKGIALEGASLYCTTFPCPPCAKQIAYSGIKKLYYRDGYAVLDGERILKDKGVEIILVDIK